MRLKTFEAVNRPWSLDIFWPEAAAQHNPGLKTWAKLYSRFAARRFAAKCPISSDHAAIQKETHELWFFVRQLYFGLYPRIFLAFSIASRVSCGSKDRL